MAKEESGVSKEVAARYRTRLGFLKNGREYFKSDDYVNATKNYTTYIQIVAEYKGKDEKKLSPKDFDQKQELSEMLLISHTFFDLARIYDRTPSLRKELDRVLNQFVNFTVGFKYQVPNSGMIKRFIKKKKLINKASFDSAYSRVKVQTKGCYVATHCFGEEAIETTKLRKLRDQNVVYPMAHKMFNLYYKYSPKLVSFLDRNPRISSIVNPILRRLIRGIIKLANI